MFADFFLLILDLALAHTLIALAHTLIALAYTLIALAHTLIALAHTLIALAHTLIALTHLNSTEKLHRLSGLNLFLFRILDKSGGREEGGG